MEIEIGGAPLILHTSGAIFLPGPNMLLISDVHLGKVMHFRKHGMAVPAEFLTSNFDKLTAVCDHFQADSICFLGDLFHSKLNREWFLFEDWTRSRKEKIVLVSGNHDVIPRSFYENIGITVTDEVISGNFLLVHEPEVRDGLYTICGHIHPGFRLSGPGRQFLTLKCFFRSQQQLILPAFGTFTGKYTLEKSDTDIVYAIAGEDIVKVENS